MLDTEHGLWPSLLNRQIPGSSPRHRNTNFRGYAWESVGTTGPSLGQSLPVTILGLLGHRPTSNICSLSSNGSPPRQVLPSLPTCCIPPARVLVCAGLWLHVETPRHTFSHPKQLPCSPLSPRSAHTYYSQSTGRTDSGIPNPRT